LAEEIPQNPSQGQVLKKYRGGGKVRPVLVEFRKGGTAGEIDKGKTTGCRGPRIALWGGWVGSLPGLKTRVKKVKSCFSPQAADEKSRKRETLPVDAPERTRDGKIQVEKKREDQTGRKRRNWSGTKIV